MPPEEGLHNQAKVFEPTLPDLWKPVNGYSSQAGAESRERQPDQREGVRRVRSPQPLGRSVHVPGAGRWALVPEGASRLFPRRVALGGPRDCHGPFRLTPNSLGAGEGRRCSRTLGSTACTAWSGARRRHVVDPGSLGWVERQGQALGSEGVPGLRLLGTSESPTHQACRGGRVLADL